MDNRTPALVIDHLPTWCEDLDDYCNHFNTQGNPHLEVKITYMLGKKYARIVESNISQKFAFCFIDLSNGDILKAASWASPAKHSRGNIFNKNGDIGVAVGRYGAKYL